MRALEEQTNKWSSRLYGSLEETDVSEATNSASRAKRLQPRALEEQTRRLSLRFQRSLEGTVSFPMIEVGRARGSRKIRRYLPL